MNNVIEVTDATFVSEVLGASKPVLIDYWADWCAPCKQLSPIIEELAGTYGDRMGLDIWADPMDEGNGSPFVCVPHP